MNERIYLDSVSSHEEFTRFRRMQNYVVPAGRKHQIVIDGHGRDIGIVVSNNGRMDFRVDKKEIVYWYGGPYAYIVDSPLSCGRTVRLE